MQNNSKNINRLISVLWNRKWRIMLGTLIGAAVLWVLSTVVIKPVYTASMSMYVYGNKNRSAAEETALRIRHHSIAEPGRNIWSDHTKQYGNGKNNQTSGS